MLLTYLMGLGGQAPLPTERLFWSGFMGISYGLGASRFKSLLAWKPSHVYTHLFRKGEPSVGPVC